MDALNFVEDVGLDFLRVIFAKGKGAANRMERTNLTAQLITVLLAGMSNLGHRTNGITKMSSTFEFDDTVAIILVTINGLTLLPAVALLAGFVVPAFKLFFKCLTCACLRSRAARIGGSE